VGCRSRIDWLLVAPLKRFCVFMYRCMRTMTLAPSLLPPQKL
jgi:hypothetical protein